MEPKGRSKKMNKQRIKRDILLIILTLLALTILLTLPKQSSETHIKLLAVSQAGNNSLIGQTADLYLDLVPGDGQVFIDTAPLTKIDTQISTRFARQIACKEAKVDCSRYNFLYTIRASAPIIGGPSASGAIATITLARLKDLPINTHVSMTGTINSGGLIGPVGGVKQKIEAAAEDKNIKIVLIPKIELYENKSNSSSKLNLSLIDYGKSLGIKVIPVKDISETLYYFTGKNTSVPIKKVDNKEYKTIMKSIATDLCNRAIALNSSINLTKVYAKLRTTLHKENISNDTISDYLNASREMFNQTNDLINKSKLTFSEGNYYSAASYCFGANVKLSSLYVIQKNNLSSKTKQVNQSLLYLSSKINQNFSTITQLQTYLIVEDRLREAITHLNRVNSSDKDYFQKSLDIAYSNERAYTIYLWLRFNNMSGQKFNFGRASLSESCIQSISEAETNYEYLRTLLNLNLSYINDDLNQAKQQATLGNYAVCLYESAKTKAELDMLSSTLGVRKNEINTLLDYKLKAAERSVYESMSNNIFPIMAYSYYEYANSLKNTDKYSALLYAEEAIELSNLDIYFKKETKSSVIRQIFNRSREFNLGFSVGLLLMVILCLCIDINNNYKQIKIKRRMKARAMLNKHKKKK